MAGIPLEEVPGWSHRHIARLEEKGIRTAQQVVAIGATPRGIRSLAEELDLPEAEVRSLVESARTRITPQERSEMEVAVDPDELGLGAIRPPENDENR